MSKPAPADATILDSRRYQRRRLWLGIGGIGVGLVLQWGLLIGCAPAWWDQELAGAGGWAGGWAGGLVALLLAAAIVLLQFPFDIMGRRVDAAAGMLGPRTGRDADGADDGADPADSTADHPDTHADTHADTRADISADTPEPNAARTRITAVARETLPVALRWIAAATFAGLLLGTLQAVAPESRLAWSLLAFAGLAIVSAAVGPTPGPSIDPADVADADWHDAVATELRGLGHVPPRTRWFDHGEISLAGGWHGLGRGARLWLSTTLADLTPRVAARLIVRELAHRDRGDRFVGLLGSIVWIGAGLVLADLIATALQGDRGVGPASIVMITAATMSTWCWLGLFVWPALGRRQVLAADRAMLAGAEPIAAASLAAEALEAIAERNRPDESLPPIVAAVFHPIPPMNDRRAALRVAAGDAAAPAVRRVAEAEATAATATPADDPTPDPSAGGSA